MPSSPVSPASVRILPPPGARFAPEQQFDIRVEGLPSAAQGDLHLRVDDHEVPFALSTHAGHLDATVRGFSLVRPGPHEIVARFGHDGRVSRTVHVERLAPLPPTVPGRRPTHGAKNVIFFLGDGMGLAHRTAARILSRGYESGRAKGRLAMDDMEASGLVMTSSLNALITDSAPGMAAYTSGNKANNNQMGVFPDDTPDDAFDNPAVEYLSSWLRRRRGPGFHSGVVTTADLTDATPAACLVHVANRTESAGIARRLVDARDTHGLSVLVGGGRRRFQLKRDNGEQDDRDLQIELAQAGFALADDEPTLVAAGHDRHVSKLLALLHPETMNTAFDKLGQAAGYSDELRAPAKEELRKQPSLTVMTSAALEILARSSPAGFFLVVEGASIDKKSHDQDAERAIWDVIELDNAVARALAFAKATNENDDPDDDTLVIVTADHETGGLALVAVGNERYQPNVVGKAVREYAANLRFELHQTLPLFPNYEPGPDGFPRDPDPSRKLIMSFGAGTDRYENFTSNRLARPATKLDEHQRAVANPERDAPTQDLATDNRNVGGRAIAGFLVPGVLENRADPDPTGATDTGAVAAVIAGHTASDVPLSASGPGASTFVGTFDNTDAFFKMASVLSAWRGRPRPSNKPPAAGAGPAAAAPSRQ